MQVGTLTKWKRHETRRSGATLLCERSDLCQAQSLLSSRFRVKWTSCWGGAADAEVTQRRSSWRTSPPEDADRTEAPCWLYMLLMLFPM
ncbi:hypothetical protein FKM82_029940 [Ascaphus truei]